MIKNGILLHVYNLQTKDWVYITWGDPGADKFGTVTQLAYTLLTIPVNEQVTSIVYSGPSMKDGLTEGQYTKQYLLDRIHELEDFPSLKRLISELSPNDYDVFVRRIQELITGPLLKNTLDEVFLAAGFFNQEPAVDKVFQISVAGHAPRCLKNQLIAREEGKIPKRQPWHVIASDTDFLGDKLDDVVIIEPPHRGDDPMVGFTPTLASAIKPYFTLGTEKKKRLIKMIQDAVSNLQGE
jgi:hypothetical protein